MNINPGHPSRARPHRPGTRGARGVREECGVCVGGWVGVGVWVCGWLCVCMRECVDTCTHVSCAHPRTNVRKSLPLSLQRSFFVAHGGGIDLLVCEHAEYCVRVRNAVHACTVFVFVRACVRACVCVCVFVCVCACVWLCA